MKDATLKQARKVLDLIADQKISSEQLQKVLDSGLLSDLLYGNFDQADPDGFRNEFRKLLGLRNMPRTRVTWRNQLKSWEHFYCEVFGLELNISNVRIPEIKQGFGRLLVIAHGMRPQVLFDKCTELFLCWKWIDSNLNMVVKSIRTADRGAYAVWVRDQVEADEELRDLSFNQLADRKIAGITLEERLLFGLKYFNETGWHLDLGNKKTICSGSMVSGGSIPYVFFNEDDNRVMLHRCHADARSTYASCRQVVC